MTRLILSSLASSVACGYNMTLSVENESLLFIPDDDWNENYESNMDCYWFFEADADKSVKLEIMSVIDIESSRTCMFDYLAVSTQFMIIRRFVPSTAAVI